MLNVLQVVIEGAEGRPIPLDVHWHGGPPDVAKPVVVFAHGFKGFKDWGAWQLVAESFAREGMVFVKFNFSHNGTTLGNPLNFGDLEAFGNNNFTKELHDLGNVVDWVHGQMYEKLSLRPDLERLHLIGHSRGGGVSLLKAAEDGRIKKLALWAAVSRLLPNQSEAMAARWKKEGVTYVLNGRTKQNMPLYWQLCEDFTSNASRLDIEKAARKLDMPVLVAHGTSDPAVPLSNAYQLNGWCKNGRLLLLENADHVFGTTHPFLDDELPQHAARLTRETIRFFKE